MALPDYSAAAMNNNQQRRAMKRDRRQERRARNQWTQPMSTDEVSYPSGTSQSTAQPHQYGYDFGPGYQGPYTPPANSQSHPFYDPNATYARQGGQHYQLQEGSDLHTRYGDQNPQSAYISHLGKLGLGGMDARSQAAQGMYRDFAGGFEASKLNNNFEGHWGDFLAMQDIPGLLERMSSEQIGLDTTQYGGRGRWSLRGQ
jgi:hypothetical protein